jgi:general secretion pathway protein G
MKTKSNKKAFSIIELIFVLALLGIVASIAVSKLMNSRQSAIATTIKQDVDTITTSIQSYYMINNKIDKITDSVKINQNNWDIQDKKVEFKVEEKICVSIEVTSTNLDINIDPTSSVLCQDIYDNGVRSSKMELF